MATPEEVAALRLLIAESTEETYTDAQLIEWLDAASGNENLVAYEIWTQKAAGYAGLVDVSEGGSSRKMGDLHEQALNMARVFAERSTAESLPPDGTAGVRIRKLVRP